MKRFLKKNLSMIIIFAVLILGVAILGVAIYITYNNKNKCTDVILLCISSFEQSAQHVQKIM